MNRVRQELDRAKRTAGWFRHTVTRNQVRALPDLATAKGRALYEKGRTLAVRRWKETYAAVRSRFDEHRRFSLRRMARREKSRLATEATSRGWQRRAVSGAVEVLRDQWSIVVLCVFAFVPLVIPVPAFSYFAGSTDRLSFLETLWQVQGAALGLSLAVVLFVFQSVYGSRLGGSLRDFAEETWLFPIFYAGVLGLTLDGLVLLDVGYGAPSGWAASWATVWAAGTAISLVVLFVSTIRAIDPRGLQAMRMRRTSRAIRSEVEDVILRRVASAVLTQFCTANDIDFTPIFGQAHGRASVPVSAGSDGVITDIRLGRLRKIAAAATTGNLRKPRLRAEIGSSVRVGTELAWLDGAQGALAPAVAKAFRIRRRARRAFKSTIDDLHEDALLAIRMPSPAAYAAVVELYERVLLALPETWARYGQQYVGAIAGGANPFEFSIQDYLERNLYEEMTLAAASGNRDVAHDALDLPIITAQQALDLRALALSGRMIRLWVAARHPLIRDADAQPKSRPS
jgi:hypothetical protein